MQGRVPVRGVREGEGVLEEQEGGGAAERLLRAGVRGGGGEAYFGGGAEGARAAAVQGGGGGVDGGGGEQRVGGGGGVGDQPDPVCAEDRPAGGELWIFIAFPAVGLQVLHQQGDPVPAAEGFAQELPER